MKIFDSISKYGHEQVVLCHEEATGLRAVIVIHNTILGPALGGCRMWPFESEEEAISDALRLSRGMTYKNAAAGLNLGGGKAVIIGNPNKDKSEALFRAFGRFVQSLGGRYITAEDVGTSVEDMEYINMETEFVAGLPEQFGGSGDPSPFTALGVFEGIKASVKYRLNKNDLKGIRVAVQGAGHVGYYLCEMLDNAGAELVITDIFEEKVEKVVSDFGADAVAGDDIYSVDADVFAPCALGAILNDDTISRMKFKVIAGGANNQLLDEDIHGKKLKGKNILYAPDYLINAGGVTNVFFEVINEYSRDRVTKKVKNIYNILTEVYRIADKEDITTAEAAARLAEKRLNLIRSVHQNYLR
ncbi:MAG: Glu/Leu/Phe/Val dehydrogenase [Calditrichales bacterium]|nr:MAG: Glu/Leu/Phe/Val dehydrogenase [Calditrichales bacterium]